MSLGFALLAVLLVLRTASANRHLRGRLTGSAVAAGLYALIAASLSYGRLSAAMQSQLEAVQPLLLAFIAINSLVALLINPWRVDRLPDRFPTIVQDAIVIGLFGLTATLLLQERIFAATAAGAVVIGLALQDTLGNLFAGLAIQIEKPFRVGHWVRIADVDGMVTEVTWRATKIRTKGGNFVIVPNSKLSGDIIINYSEPTLESRIEVEVGVSYDAAPNVVKQTILDALRDEPLILKSREPEVLIVDFAGSSVNYRVRVWTTDFAADERLRDRIRSAIYYAFKRHAIEIPYPIQVEYSRQEQPPATALDPDAARSLRGVPIFAPLGDVEHGELAKAARSFLYGAGEHIVRQGDPGESMFVVVRGEVVVTLAPDNREVARVGAGDFFGEMSLLTGAPRTATVKAAVDSQVVEITVGAFRRLVLANPAVVEQIGREVAERRAELEERRASGVAAAVEAPHSLVNRIKRFLGLDD